MTEPIPPATIESDLGARAFKIFESRNEAFRIIFDTLIEVENAPDEETAWTLLCANIKKLCHARSALFFSYEESSHTVIIESAITDAPTYTHVRTTISTTSNDIPAMLVETPHGLCDGSITSIAGILPGEVKEMLSTFPDTDSYYFSSIHEKKLIAVALVQIDRNRDFKIKDIVDIYMNMAGIIIDRAHALRTLSQKEEHLRTVLDSIQVGVMIVDLTTHTIIEVNSFCQKLFKASRESILNKPCQSYLCHHKNGICSADTSSGNAAITEEFLINTDGRSVPVLRSTTTIEWQGRRCCIESFIDITSRKDAENQLTKNIEELKRFQKVAINRENIMLELKKTVNKLSKELGRPEPHDLSFLDKPTPRLVDAPTIPERITIASEESTARTDPPR